MVRTIFIHSFRSFRGHMIGWGIVMMLLGALTVPSYEVVANNAKPLLQMVENLPKAFTAFFGDMSKLDTAAGFLTIKYYSFLPLIIGIFAVVGLINSISYPLLRSPIKGFQYIKQSLGHVRRGPAGRRRRR